MSVENRRPLTENERLYIGQKLRSRRNRRRAYALLVMGSSAWFGLFAAVFLAIPGFFVFGIGFMFPAAGLLGLSVFLFLRAGAPAALPEEIAPLAGIYRFEYRRRGRSRRIVRFIGEWNVSLPNHWAKLLKAGDQVRAEACAYPAPKGGNRAAVSSDPAFELVSLNGTYTVDREVPLGLLKLKGVPMSLGIACVLGLFVVMFSVPLVDLRVAPWESVRTLTSRLNAAGFSEEGTERTIERPLSAAEFFSLVFSVCFLAMLPFLTQGLIILARDRAITKTIGRYYQSEG